jgi:hypothetical protein
LDQIGYLQERRVIKGNVVLKDESVIVIGGNSNCNVERFSIEDNTIANVNVGDSFHQLTKESLTMYPSF